MKKLLTLILALTVLVGLSACNSGVVRSRENLPQSTRLDAAAIAAIPITSGTSALADAGSVSAPAVSNVDAPEPEQLTFFEREDGVIVFHVAHQAAYAHPIHLGILRFQEEVAARSGGALVAEVFGNESVGGDGALLSMVNDNQVDVALITIWGLWHTMTDLANLESLPFVFTNYDDAWAAYEGELGDWVADNIIEPHGGKVLSFYTNGLRHFTNSVRPIETPADMVGLRMRSPQIATNLFMYEELGAASISMPFGQLYAALADGSVDGQDNPLGNIYASQLFEVQDYLSLSSHMFSSAPLIASTDFWNALSAEHQQILLESAVAAARYQGELTRNMEVTQLGEIAASGTQINQVDLDTFLAAVEPIWEDHIERFGREFINIASRYISDPTALANRFGE
ncbi:MAG: TRAP transporter substrate-binding protein [Oscillospiraceae bacterium]|nr:TRAP transporter substrate-binding protein [Oscillospiraceae bacterium]